MTFHLEEDETLLTVVCNWHPWDLSDCIVPAHFNADEDIEEDWRTTAFMFPVNLVTKASAESLVTALNAWTFEAIKDDSEDDDLHNTPFGDKLNAMLTSAYLNDNWETAIPEIVKFINDHKREHLRLVINRKEN